MEKEPKRTTKGALPSLALSLEPCSEIWCYPPFDSLPALVCVCALPVKVVASRYAQSLQKQNLDARQRTRSAPSVSTTAASAGGATKRPASSISQDSSVAKAHGGPGTIRTESAPPPSDLRDRLAAYRANKAQLKKADSTNSRSKPQAPTGKAQSMQRPAFPQRISTPERPVKRPAKDPAVPKQTRTLSFTHDAAPSGKSIKPATSSSAKVLSAPAATTMCGDEEIELLQSLYLQLCFADAKAADTFRRQEQSAEVTTLCLSPAKVSKGLIYYPQTQMIAAWKLLQSKLQLIQDTTLRLDRDKHVKAVEEHLLDQVRPLVKLGDRLKRLTSSPLEGDAIRTSRDSVACTYGKHASDVCFA